VISRRNQARATCQSRLTVRGDEPTTAAVSSTVRPPKKRSFNDARLTRIELRQKERSHLGQQIGGIDAGGLQVGLARARVLDPHRAMEHPVDWLPSPGVRRAPFHRLESAM
jgi:hypothetical protein